MFNWVRQRWRKVNQKASLSPKAVYLYVDLKTDVYASQNSNSLQENTHCSGGSDRLQWRTTKTSHMKAGQKDTKKLPLDVKEKATAKVALGVVSGPDLVHKIPSLWQSWVTFKIPCICGSCPDTSSLRKGAGERLRIQTRQAKA